MIDESYKHYATETQIKYIDGVNEHGSQRACARNLGVAKTTVDQAIKSIYIKAALAGFSPQHQLTNPVPDPFVVKGYSTCYNADGEVSQQWIKTTLADNKFQQMLLEAIEAMKEDIPRLLPMQLTAHGNDKLLNCYVITDYHMGMLAWGEETYGEDWDLKKSEELVIKWFQQAIAQSPDADTAIFCQLGDFLHFDGLDAVTPAAKNLLDVDTRFAKVVRTAIRVIRTIIDMLLSKHSQVHIIMADANHDPVSGIWLREWLFVMYENEPRISVDRSPNPYLAYEFGQTALFFHHGHKQKVGSVAQVFAGQFREMFGRCKYSFAHIGHLHHIDVKENQLMVVEQHRTLSPADAYAARGGWLSGRDAKVITYHKSWGEVSRLTINSDMLK